MLVCLQPLAPQLWHGDTRGYRLEFKRHDHATFDVVRDIDDQHANSYVIDALEEYMTYSMRMVAYNSAGSSAYSPMVSDTTRESSMSVLIACTACVMTLFCKLDKRSFSVYCNSCMTLVFCVVLPAPSAGPQSVEAEPVNSTSIRVTWQDVPLLDRNGEIEGYKVGHA